VTEAAERSKSSDAAARKRFLQDTLIPCHEDTCSENHKETKAANAG